MTNIWIGVGRLARDPEVRYAESGAGGTSLSSPLFAGVMALADQRGGFAHGFVNPALYALNGTTAFRDIVDPTGIVAAVRVNWNNGLNARAGRNFGLRTFNFTGTLHTTPGYDNVTGLGTPNGESFLAALA